MNNGREWYEDLQEAIKRMRNVMTVSPDCLLDDDTHEMCTICGECIDCGNCECVDKD